MTLIQKENFMKDLISFLQGRSGRIARVVLGLALVYVGLAMIGGTAGLLLAIVGLLPIAMGIWGPCLLGFVFKSI
jgi:hypothetical protein